MDWQKLALEGHVNQALMQKVIMLCDMFFWIGWHARDAIDEAEQLKEMVDG